MEQEYQVPTVVLYESARRKIKTAVNTEMQKNNLPPFIMEGILSECISELRSLKMDELCSGYTEVIKALSEVKEDNEDADTAIRD